MGMKTWASDPVVTPDEIVASGAMPATLDDLLKQCNAITLHVPLSDATEHMIGARELALMPRGSYLINTARGPLVNTEAVLAALDSGQLAGAALDVLSEEPPTASHPAPQHPRLIVTPHAAWYSPASEREVIEWASRSLRVLLEGRRPAQGVVLSGKELSID